MNQFVQTLNLLNDESTHEQIDKALHVNISDRERLFSMNQFVQSLKLLNDESPHEKIDKALIPLMCAFFFLSLESCRRIFFSCSRSVFWYIYSHIFFVKYCDPFKESFVRQLFSLANNYFISAFFFFFFRVILKNIFLMFLVCNSVYLQPQKFFVKFVILLKKVL